MSLQPRTIGTSTSVTSTECCPPSRSTNTLEKLQRHFGSWFSDPLCTITADRIESWKQRRLRGGCTGTTVLRDLFTPSSVLSRAVRLGELADNPIRRVDKPRIDRRGKVRFLDEAEEIRLRDTLEARDVEMRCARESANAWRQARNRSGLPPLPHFGDHLTPAVLLSMNTGLRRSELLKLRWSSVDFARRLLTIEGANARSRQTRHVPLNDEALSVLTGWRAQSGETPRLFHIATGLETAWSHILKRARITGFH